MYNWSTDEEKLKKDYPWEYQKWRLLQMINYGLDGERINLKLLRKFWPKIREDILDKLKVKFFEKYVFKNEKHFDKTSKRNS